MTMCMMAAALGLAAGSAGADEIKIELKDGKFVGANMEHVGFNEGDNRVFMYSKATAEFKVMVPEEGEYVLKMEMACDPAMNKFAQVKIMAGGKSVKDAFDLTQGDPKEYEFTVKLAKGEQKLSVEYLNDLYKEGEYDMNFYLHGAKLQKAVPAAKK